MLRALTSTCVPMVAMIAAASRIVFVASSTERHVFAITNAGYLSNLPYVATVTLTMRGVKLVPVTVDFACTVDCTKG